jgi:mitochondrial fission protein ELM1
VSAAARGEVWALLSHRSGESQQILGLAEALERDHGLPFRVLEPRWTPQANLLGLTRRTSLAGLRPESRDALGARSPDIVLSAGLRNEPVCRWIARRSRQRSLTVMLGRTWAPPAAFDLVVTTPQYRLPAHPHVLENPLTQHRLSPERLASARHAFEARYGALARPRLGVLVGGDSGPFHLSRSVAERLAERALDLAGGGTVIATTSSRTPRAAGEALAERLGPPHDLWRWNRETVNPYFGILAWADALLVTGDSIAMVSEAVATGKPVRIFDTGGMRDGRGARGSLKASAYRALMRHGPERLSRDLSRVHEQLVADGLAAWDEAPLPADGAATPAVEDHMALTTRRIVHLLHRRRA